MSEHSPLFGIIGGMGPLASTQFLHSIYFDQTQAYNDDQDYPRVVLISDPTVPDRTRAYSENKKEGVISFFEKAVHDLDRMGVDEIIIACVTAHYFLDFLSEKTRSKITSLVSLLFAELDKLTQPALILSSKMLNELQLIDHPNLIYPAAEDAKVFNKLIFQMKSTIDAEVFSQFLELSDKWAEKYNVQSLVFCCTELHIVHTMMQGQKIKPAYTLLDPLQIAVKYILNKHRSHQDGT